MTPSDDYAKTPSPSQHTLTLLCANVTSWKPHRDSLLQINPDILVLQETGLTLKGQRDESKLLQGRGYQCFWGLNCAQKHSTTRGFARTASGVGKQGGVGIVCSKRAPALATSHQKDVQFLHDFGRWVRCAVALGSRGTWAKRFLHIISLYNYSGRDSGVLKTCKERLLQRAFQDAAQMGSQPTLLCMDCNTNIQNSPVLRTVLNSGLWVDLGSFFTDGKPDPTFSSSKSWDRINWDKGVSRPDLIFANRAALSLCSSFKVVRDLETKGHLGLMLELKTEFSLQAFSTLRFPRPFPMHAAPACAEAQKQQLAESFVQEALPEFTKARKSLDSDAAWAIFANTAESYLQCRCQSASEHPSGEHGRHRPALVVQQTPTCPSADKTHPECTDTVALVTCFKHLRRARELRVKMFRLSGQAPVGQDDADIHNLWHKLLTHDVVLQVCRAPCRIHDLETVDSIIAALAQHAEDLQSSQVARRCNAWEHKMRESFRSGGKAVYAWLRDSWQPSLNALQNRKGEVVLGAQDLADLAKEEWSSLFNQPQQASWDFFKAVFQEYLEKHPCQLPPICAKDLKRQIQCLKASRAIAIDGWRVQEMMDLPLNILEMAAELFRDIEAGSPWPLSNCTAIVSCIPKHKSEQEVSDERPSVAAPVPLDTRPISNLSPWTTVYSGLRYISNSNPGEIDGCQIACTERAPNTKRQTSLMN